MVFPVRRVVIPAKAMFMAASTSLFLVLDPVLYEDS